MFCGGLYYGVRVFSGCPPSWVIIGETSFSCSNTLVDKTWRIYWQDGNTSTKGNSAQAQCSGTFFITECPPRFENPRSFPTSINGVASEEWTETAYNRKYNGDCVNNGYNTVTATHACPIYGGGCLSGFTVFGERFKDDVDSAEICSPCDPDPSEVFLCQQSGGTYDWASCQCGQSPIIIDVLGNGFNLTNAANGVSFDINGDHTSDQIAWSSANSDDAWLALDRNSNGVIDNGKELFGNSTAQSAPPAGEMKNGFLALAVFDKIQNGGNEDGIISQQDVVFSSLRLWQDKNHNGISEASEMKTLSELGLAKIELDYAESRRTDEHGNRFRYRAKVRDTQGAQIGRWAWDVYLVVQTPQN